MSIQAPLKEEEIRPANLMAKQKEAVAFDIKKLLANKKRFVVVNCPACGSKPRKEIFKKRGFNYVSCQSCSTFYVSPRPTLELIEDFFSYSKNYLLWNNYIFPASEAARRTKIFAPRVDKVLEIGRKYGVATEALLEVGGGFGTFCSELKSRNIFKKVVVVEPSASLAATMRSRSIDVIEKTIETVSLSSGELFDIVASFEVIEHLFSAVDYLSACRKFLKKNGLLIITCPNGQGFEIETLGAASDSVDHEHLNYFNPGSMEILLDQCGFKLLEVLTPGKLDADIVRNKILSGAFKINNQPFLKKVLIAEWEKYGAAFQQFLATSGLSSHMWAVARVK